MSSTISWTCDECGLINNSSTDKCQACFTYNPTKCVQCIQCEFLNPPQSQKCQACFDKLPLTSLNNNPLYEFVDFQPNPDDPFVIVFGTAEGWGFDGEWDDAKVDQNPDPDTKIDETDDEDDDKSPYDENGEYIHTFYDLISIIESTQLLQDINESTLIFSTILAEMVIKSRLIDINYKTMLLNISKKGWSQANGTYGLANLFQQNNRCYCSSAGSVIFYNDSVISFS